MKQVSLAIHDYMFNCMIILQLPIILKPKMVFGFDVGFVFEDFFKPMMMLTLFWIILVKDYF